MTLERILHQTTSRGPFQPKLFYDSKTASKKKLRFFFTASDVKMKCSEREKKKKKKPENDTNQQTKKIRFSKEKFFTNTELFPLLQDIWEKLMPKTLIHSRQYSEFYSQRTVALIEYVMKTAVGKDAPQQICLGVSQPMHIHSPHALPVLASWIFFPRSQSVFTVFWYLPVQH